MSIDTPARPPGAATGCQGCGERIVTERLLAVPYTRSCVPCAQRGERLR